jgi:restriction system protein
VEAATVDVNPGSPWNPKVPPDISSADFEAIVLEWLRRVAERRGETITTEHLALVHGGGGAYRIDVFVTFTVLGGALFKVLVECKHQGRPLEREDVMVLESKLRDTNAQKAMLFSTSGFQSGALEFAAAKNIATVAVVEGEWFYETRAAGMARPKPPAWVHLDRHAGIRMTKTATGVSLHTIEMARTDALEEWLAENCLKRDSR